MRRLFCTILLLSPLLLSSIANSAEVNVYSARKEALIKPLLKRFTEETGIKVNLVTGKADALIKRLEVEGKNSPADVLLTVDAARLHRAKQQNLLQKVHSDYLSKHVPQNYRDDEGYWYGLSLRSRVIVYSPERVPGKQLSSYEDLADPKWQKKLCVRSSSNVYNQSLVASLIAHNGAEATEKWAKGLVNNFARSPKGGDRDQVKAVAVGQCDLALVNTYYVGGMLESKVEAEKKAASKVSVFWPNQSSRGAHVNLSGIGITQSAQHKKEAIKLLEYLVSDAAQTWYAKANYEYPVVAGVANSALLKQWGEFKPDAINMDLLGKYNAEAVLLMDRAGWK
ncbi:Fe(3+) ABC transporter substrate-binding protein [Aliikangiella coralliicola]|nr:Fe(3+) ABC transporter substrate-binding protein [Aliikangiella coralliicola]